MGPTRSRAPTRDRQRRVGRPASHATLLLIRHGHTPDNTPGAGARLLGWTDAPLGDTGREQVHLLCARMLAEREVPAALYTSPLRRALDTARLLGDALDVRPRLRAGLREIHCGALDGLPVERVRREHAVLWRRNQAQEDDSFRWPGGESYAEFRARCLAAVGRIAAAHPGGRVAVVTHAGVITQVLGALHGIPAARWGAFRAGNASLTVVRWPAGGATGGDGAGAGAGISDALEVFDDRAHLAGAPPACGREGRRSAAPHGVRPPQDP
jgi:broad specificity phosphatase PhoE